MEEKIKVEETAQAFQDINEPQQVLEKNCDIKRENNENDECSEPKKAKNASYVWQHFTKIDKYSARCNTCSKILKIPGGSTSSLDRHFLSKHSRKKRESIAGVAAKPKIVDPLNKDSEKAKAITRGLGYMITKDLQPYSIVEDAGFKYLLQAAEPRYVLPSRNTLSKVIIPAMYTEESERLKIKLLNDLTDVDVVTMTTDGWTSRAVNNYVTLTIHYVNAEFVNEHISLGVMHLPGRHTAANIETFLVDTLQKWNLTEALRNIQIYWVTDNAANMVKAISLNKDWRRIPCFAHTLQLAVNNCKSVNADIDNTIKKCKQIVTHFSMSCIAKESLANAQLPGEPKRLVQQVDTRWNSHYDMFERMVELKSPLSLVLSQMQNMTIITKKEWILIKGYLEVFRPLKDATVMMSGETYPTASLYIPVILAIIYKLEVNLENYEEIDVRYQLSERLLENMKNRFDELLEMDTLIIAMLINPRYKNKLLIESNEKKRSEEILKNSAVSYAEKNNPERKQLEEDNDVKKGPSKNEILSFFETMIGETEEKEQSIESEVEMEIFGYFQEKCINITDCPLTWWKSHGQRFPILRKIAKDYLGIIGTQVPSEREFSTSGNIVTATRARLLNENIEMISFLHTNFKNINFT